MIKIILADDHVMVRQGVRMMLEAAGDEFKVIGEVSNGEELLKLAKKNVGRRVHCRYFHACFKWYRSGT